MKDELKAQYFRDLMGLDLFQAQLALEDETYNSLLTKLLTIDVSKGDVALEYAKIRGSLDALKMIKSSRERLSEFARSRQ